jgi:hypothetical protein
MSPVAVLRDAATPQPSSVNHANSLAPFFYITELIFKDASSAQMSIAQSTAYSKAIAVITGVDVSDIRSFSATNKQKKLLNFVYKVFINIEVENSDVPSKYQEDYNAYTIYLDGLFDDKLSEILAEYNKQLAKAGLATEDNLTILGSSSTGAPTLTPGSGSTSASTSSASSMSDGAIAGTVLGIKNFI